LVGKPKTKENILDQAEIQRLFDACKTKTEKFVIASLIYTGMRESEFVHMTKSWIDFNRWIIKIPSYQSCSCYDCRLRGGFWKPKTKAAIRVIPIVPEYRPYITEFFSNFNRVQDVIKDRQSLKYIVKQVAKDAKLKKRVFPHALRGTFATILAAKDFNPYEITAVMGWASVKVADEYINLVGARVIKAFEEKWDKQAGQ